MNLPSRPASIDELRARIASSELRESRVLEFKREFPSNNKALARQIAALAADGGVLVLGVAETGSSLEVTPIDCKGARERVEQIARDIPQPPVQVTSHILDADTPELGVLWVEIPASPQLAHEIDGAYYTRGDTQSRPMRDSEVAERHALRKDRPRPILAALAEALEREEPPVRPLYGRTCLVARPIGASSDEFYQATRTHEAWESFVDAIHQPIGFLHAVPYRYWGQVSHRFADSWRSDSPGLLALRRDIEFQENGAFCHLSYSLDWLKDQRGGIFPYSTLLACWEATQLVAAVQARTEQRRMWDLAFSISNVEGRVPRTRGDQFPRSLHQLPIPRDHYRESTLGVSTERLEDDPLSIVRELTRRFIDECGLDFDEEWSPTGIRLTG